MPFHIAKAAIADRFSVADDWVVKRDTLQLVVMLEPDDSKSDVDRLVLTCTVVQCNNQVIEGKSTTRDVVRDHAEDCIGILGFWPVSLLEKIVVAHA